MKRRGDIETFDLGEVAGNAGLAGVVLGIRHEGHQAVKAWERKADALRIAEARRVRALVAEHGEEALRDAFPERFIVAERTRLEMIAELERTERPVPERLLQPFGVGSVITTPEGQAEQEGHLREVVAQVAVSLALPGVAVLGDASTIVEEVERLGCLEVAAAKAREVQRISAPQFPAAADPGDARPGGDAAGESAGGAGGV